MTRSSTLIGLGVILVIAPYIGLPRTILNILIPLLGVVVFGIGFAIRRERVKAAAETVVETIVIETESVEPGPSAIA